MLHSPSRRGQTEPLGALVAVVAVIIAVTLYAGFVTDTLPGTTDRAIEETAIERVWHDIGDDGVYTAWDTDADDLAATSAPGGHTVVVVVTTTDSNGEPTTVDSYHITGGDDYWDEGRLDPSPDARVTSRPIPVETTPGDVRGGTLRLEVW